MDIGGDNGGSLAVNSVELEAETAVVTTDVTAGQRADSFMPFFSLPEMQLMLPRRCHIPSEPECAVWQLRRAGH